MKNLRPLLLASIYLVVVAQSAHAQTYQMQFASSGLKASAATPPGPVEPPAPPPPVCAPETHVFNTAGETSWAMPAGCSQANFKVWGAGGGSLNALGGAGGFVGGTLALPAGESVTLRIGNGGLFVPATYTNQGGGLSGVWRSGLPQLIAGGGGGAGNYSRGGAAGQAGEGTFVGQPGTTSAGGSGCNGARGGAWVGGVVQTPMSGYASGNGGAGYYGGGGGCAIWWNNTYYGSSGGGGSNFVADTVLGGSSADGYFQTPGAHADSDRGGAGAPTTNGRIVVSVR